MVGRSMPSLGILLHIIMTPGDVCQVCLAGCLVLICPFVPSCSNMYECAILLSDSDYGLAEPWGGIQVCFFIII